MEPDSKLLVVLLLVGSAGFLYLLVRFHHIVLRSVCGLLATVLAMVGGMAVVNDFYGYYRTWTALAADLSGNYASFGAGPATPALASYPPQKGRLLEVHFAGDRSKIARPGFVYLPPQYDQPQYAHTRFPAIELLHGSPGNETSWAIHLGIVRITDQLIDRHLMGPAVLVMPDFNDGNRYEECVNGPMAQDDTYISADVPADVERMFRVTTVRAEWGVAGYSAGGYCAANLSLRHRADYGAVGIMDGYFRPADGDAASALGNNPAAEAVNDPLAAARALPPDVAPLPAYWLSAGTGDAGDIAGARAFAAAIRRIEGVTLDVEPGVSHNFYAWLPATPHMLAWMWQELAPPALRAQFPTHSLTTGSQVLRVHLPPQRRRPVEHAGEHGKPRRTTLAGPSR